jgi:hypothetical protein
VLLYSAVGLWESVLLYSAVGLWESVLLYSAVGLWESVLLYSAVGLLESVTVQCCWIVTECVTVQCCWTGESVLLYSAVGLWESVLLYSAVGLWESVLLYSAVELWDYTAVVMNKWVLCAGEDLSARTDICGSDTVHHKLHTDGPGIESRPVTNCLGKAQHKNKKSLLLNVPHMGPEVLMVMIMNSAVLWDVMTDR